MAKTNRFALPLLSAGQAQKEITHNEALLVLDALTHGCVVGQPSNDPPEVPEIGSNYICGPAAVGDWTGHSDRVATWSQSGWRFIDPFDGLQLTDMESGLIWQHMAGQWSVGVLKANKVVVQGIKVLGAQQPAIAPVLGGTTIDAEARSTLAQILAVLRSHGLIATS